ncbi:unnamed protein product [Ambrosiozyma monospora]|uniref:Unnamed protein product n=1 Tax=Ambrosiozyma monospora TaxID=43982 RepID=A0A9W7DGK3_AMBMO|nr:unnamed protein product [Ambrosiozyma monospora]
MSNFEPFDYVLGMDFPYNNIPKALKMFNIDIEKTQVYYPKDPMGSTPLSWVSNCQNNRFMGRQKLMNAPEPHLVSKLWNAIEKSFYPISPAEFENYKAIALEVSTRHEAHCFQFSQCARIMPFLPFMKSSKKRSVWEAISPKKLKEMLWRKTFVCRNNYDSSVVNKTAGRTNQQRKSVQRITVCPVECAVVLDLLHHVLFVKFNGHQHNTECQKFIKSDALSIVRKLASEEALVPDVNCKNVIVRLESLFPEEVRFLHDYRLYTVDSKKLKNWMGQFQSSLFPNC